MRLPKHDNFSDSALLGQAKFSWKRRKAVNNRGSLAGRAPGLRRRKAASKTLRGWKGLGCRARDLQPLGTKGVLWPHPIRTVDPGAPPPVALATGRTGVSARRGDSLDQALGNRFMSRPKVGMPLDPPAFAVLYERKGGCGGIQKLGSSRRDSEVGILAEGFRWSGRK